MGTGKTTLTNKLILALEDKGYHVIYKKFASTLYDMQTEIYRLADIPLEGDKDRELLQWLGTEWGRKKDKDIWVNAWESSIKFINRNKNDKTIIITDDMRFLNEEKKVKELGGYTIKIDGPQRGDNISSTEHVSELDIDKMSPYYIFHNGRDEIEMDLNIMHSLLPSIETFFTIKELGTHDGMSITRGAKL